MRFTVSEAAKAAGVSVRTLHYYDEIGLLVPAEVSDCGYRYYDGSSLEKLERILFYRELGFSLSDTRDILSRPESETRDVLLKHRNLLAAKRRRLDEMIRAVDTLVTGEREMENIKELKKKYADEVKERWGKTPQYAEYAERERQADDEKGEQALREADDIFAAFAEMMDSDPASAEAQELCARWQKHITDNYYECTKPILSCLGEMYTEDERFRENIDRFGDGTAQFMRDAIRVYCK